MDMNSRAEIIQPGCQVEINLIDRSGNKEMVKAIIVADENADFSLGYLSEKTPIAQALLGEHAGSTIPYLKGDILAIEILAVSKPEQPPAEATAIQRQKRMEQTLREVQNTNAIVFASSFSGKWGDYDPDSIAKEKKKDDEGK